MQRLSNKIVRRIEEIIAPLRATDETGRVFEVMIQQGKPTHTPNARSNWQEVRLTRQDDGQWYLTYSFEPGNIWTVYRGRLPMDRTWWLTLLRHADMGAAGRLLSKTSVIHVSTPRILSKTSSRRVAAS